MDAMKHWQDPFNALLGACLAVSPWVMGVQDHQAIAANSVVTGLLLLAVALGATFVPRAWEEWTGSALGVWLIASPWVLGFAQMRDPMVVAVIAGVLCILLAGWVLLTDEDFHKGGLTLGR